MLKTLKFRTCIKDQYVTLNGHLIGNGQIKFVKRVQQTFFGHFFAKNEASKNVWKIIYVIIHHFLVSQNFKKMKKCKKLKISKEIEIILKIGKIRKNEKN